MLTKEQEEWISHFSNERKIEILPYNPAIKDIFEDKNEAKGVVTAHGRLSIKRLLRSANPTATKI